jgi:hypothetical protein
MQKVDKWVIKADNSDVYLAKDINCYPPVGNGPHIISFYSKSGNQWGTDEVFDSEGEALDVLSERLYTQVEFHQAKLDAATAKWKAVYVRSRKFNDLLNGGKDG